MENFAFLSCTVSPPSQTAKIEHLGIGAVIRSTAGGNQSRAAANRTPASGAASIQKRFVRAASGPTAGARGAGAPPNLPEWIRKRQRTAPHNLGNNRLRSGSNG